MASKITTSIFILLLLLCILASCTDRFFYYVRGDILHYPDAEIVDLMRLKDGFHVKLATRDSGKKILSYYKDHLNKLGYGMRLERVSVSPLHNDTKTGSFLAFFKGSEGIMIDTSPLHKAEKTEISMFMGDTDE